MGLIVGGDAFGYQVGMAPDAQWIAAKIFNDANEATLSGIHEAYQWVLDPDGNSGDRRRPGYRQQLLGSDGHDQPV